MKITNYNEKELQILREAVDRASRKSSSEVAKSSKVKEIIEIVENFLHENKLICYGGTAINNILPVYDQFYDKNIDIPDYDFFSHNALNHAIKLADIYYKKGYDNVEAKAGIHEGTYKVFVDFIPVADITNLPKNLFNTLKKDSISVYGILYAPVNYLRMSMYLELSRPKGDVSRWEKVLKRLILLNKNYPLDYEMCAEKKFIRKYHDKNINKKSVEVIFNTIKDTVINKGLVFFGGYAVYLYSKYMPKNIKSKFNKKTPDFDILSENPLKSTIILKERLTEKGFKNVKYIKRKYIGEIIPEHYELKINNDTVAFIYKTMACHNYNKIKINNKLHKIATIDTILSLYFAFLYGDRDYYDIERLMCITQFLFIVQFKNRLNQKGLLKRFVLSCYGNQETITDIRLHKSKKFELLKNKKNSSEYKKIFLKYNPSNKNLNSKTNTKKSKTKKSNTKKSNTKKSNTKKSNTKKSNTKKSNTKNSNTKKILKNIKKYLY